MGPGKVWTNQQIGQLFRQVAAAYTLKKESPFRIAAYDRAAVAIEHATSEMKDLWDDQQLESVPGVGKNIASHLDELFRTGQVKNFERLFKQFPAAVFVLLKLPRIGPKTAYKLTVELKLAAGKTAVARLKKAAKQGRIAPLPGFGEKSQAEILAAIADWEKGQTKQARMTLAAADKIAQELIAYLQQNPVVTRVDPLGSLRRRTATVGDIDLAVATDQPEKVISWFVAYPQKQKVMEKGKGGATIMLTSGGQVDLRVQRPAAYGAMLQYFTGSKHHNIYLRELALKKGISLSEHGIKQKGKVTPYATEKEFYQALEMPWIAPELRENTGEIEAALRQAQGKPNKLPQLVQAGEIKGDLHTHSNIPIKESHDPGLDSMEKLIETAAGLGYQYLGFAEHNPSQSQNTEKQIIDLLKTKKQKIEQLNYTRGKKLLKKVFNGLEIDIKPDGQLALPEAGLVLLDYGIASVHSRFDLPRGQMTKRVLSGLAHPKIKILGHPTGRKLEQREGYELDWEQVFAFCLKHDKWLEINAYPDRLDLPDTLVRLAVKQGVKMIINTDSHQAEQLALMSYGASVARRGWAEAKDIINTLDCDKIEKRLKGGDE